ncbi:hypothetical protein ACWD6R_31340 [Streptomyces sp. NPDC005151]
MKSSHSPAAVFAAFDDPNLIAHAGLVPAIRLAERCDLPRLVAEKVKLTGAGNGAGTAADQDSHGGSRLKENRLVPGPRRGLDLTDDRLPVLGDTDLHLVAGHQRQRQVRPSCPAFPRMLLISAIRRTGKVFDCRYKGVRPWHKDVPCARGAVRKGLP